MGVSGFFGRKNIYAVDVELHVPREIYAGTSVPVRVKVKSGRQRFMPVCLIRVAVEGKEVLFPLLEPGAEAEKHVDIYFPVRGIHAIKDVCVSSVFPFNFFIRYRTFDTVTEVVVFPESRQCDLPGLFEKDRGTRGEVSSTKRGYGGDLVTLRNYIPGDPLKYINWKATAKTGTLKTKELSSLSSMPVLIDYDRLLHKSVEMKISCVTFCILYFVKNNVPVGLKIGETVFAPELSQKHKLRMLKELALLPG